MLFAGGRGPDQYVGLDDSNCENCRVDIIFLEISLHPIDDIIFIHNVDIPSNHVIMDDLTPTENIFMFSYEGYD